MSAQHQAELLTGNLDRFEPNLRLLEVANSPEIAQVCKDLRAIHTELRFTVVESLVSSVDPEKALVSASNSRRAIKSLKTQGATSCGFATATTIHVNVPLHRMRLIFPVFRTLLVLALHC